MNIVIIRPDRIGDVIISSSCIIPIRKKYPEANLYYMVQSAMAPLFKGVKELTGVLTFPSIAEGTFDQRVEDITKMLQDVDASEIIHFQPVKEAYLGAEKAGVKNRIGYEFKEHTQCLTRSIPYFKYQGTKHEADYNFDLLELIDVKKPSILEPIIKLHEDVLLSVLKKIPWNIKNEKYLVVNPTAFSSTLRWPVDRFAAVVKWILENSDLKVMIIAADANDKSVIKLMRLLIGKEKRVINTAGILDLAELSWVLHFSKAHFSRNTGTSHLAAAVGCPCLDLAGRVEPEYASTRWHPLTSELRHIQVQTKRHWYEWSKLYWRRSIRLIEINDVITEFKKLLDGNYNVVPTFIS